MFKRITLLLMIGSIYAQSIAVGEEYKYDVLFGPFKLGKASLKTEKSEIINNEDTYHFQFIVKTSKLGDQLYKIRDEINTWISKNDLSLIKQEKNIREKNFRRQSTTTINNNIAITNDKEYMLPGKVVDPYGLIMIMRDINIPKNTSKKFLTIDEGKVREIEIKNIGGERIRTPAGKFDAYTYTPIYNGKSALKNKGDIEISYAIVGNNRTIPVNIIIKLKSGVIVLKLKSY
ncbi:MAG: DUF3108 domain-containing protein [Candidatus Neomarinimicrobiota bacterium]|nr:DUF3108 domain-containing protein [Candidatus Neomarinimicrobiota bacterium]MEC9455197.1 DUF3108 domain-containing protein [Candidatus Neomarinimicrobiota bacterium]MEE3242088.1 DUF3108 domain-containing protein [Candidatus Neomarinimicrobiota bacterium]MEE3301978.1 DUF3108 domain-containing protein [Candidatus Neomarinimicrobiota bacterium]